MLAINENQSLKNNYLTNKTYLSGIPLSSAKAIFSSLTREGFSNGSIDPAGKPYAMDETSIARTFVVEELMLLEWLRLDLRNFELRTGSSSHTSHASVSDVPHTRICCPLPDTEFDGSAMDESCPRRSDF